MRSILSFLFLALSLPNIAQIQMNFGLNSGITVSGFQKDMEDSFISVHGGTGGFAKFTFRDTYQPTVLYTGGIFGEVSFKNFGLKIGMNHYSVGRSKEMTFTIADFEPVNVEEHITFEEIRLDYLQIPVKLEFRFRMGVLRPFLTVGFYKSFHMNDYLYSRMEGSDGTTTVSEGVFDRFFNHGAGFTDPDEQYKPNDFAFIFGGGFYLNSRLSVEATYGKGTKKPFCPRQTTNNDSIDCHAKVLVIELNYRLFRKGF